MAIVAEGGKELETCVVLGGRGFVGKCLVDRLLRVGNWIVRIADSLPSLQLEPSESLLSHALSSGRASYFHVDVLHKSHIIPAIDGASVVFYMDSRDSYAHDFYICYTIVVQGAKNIITACQECKVKRLVYNSSAEVVLNSWQDIHGGDESLPYSSKFVNMVTDLKAQAEALVLVANDADGLLTCALRPSYVFGPEDNYLSSLLVNVAKSGWAKFIIGLGDNMSDFTYVENVAHAHICAEKALRSRGSNIYGKAFFITNHKPMKFKDFVSLVMERLGYQRSTIKIPARVVQYSTLIMKWTISRMSNWNPDNVPAFDIIELALCHRRFNCFAAQKYIGYSPVVSLEEGVALTTKSFHLARESSLSSDRDTDEESNVHKLLGGGKAAEILLWRDEQRTFTCFLLLVFIHYWFFLSGRSFLSSLAQLLLMIASALWGYSILPPTIYGIAVPRISWSFFEISEVDMRNCFYNLAYTWNRMSHLASLLAQGEDWSIFLKAAIPLYCLKLIIADCLTFALGIALALAFTSFLIYEQYEDEIDSTANVIFSISKGAFTLLMRSLPLPLALIHSDSEIPRGICSSRLKIQQ
ncbi:PREDICTED: 3beta-hydroxysteroid-dehydrogenase/decarboxylase isoform X2 [Nicotiana attenuata]|uniref:Reticulon-like protein n=1 Tax=Nicotiana attenuata TaxID=49451 RepID=A0A1J6ITY4_NICAT|nr:PREDICTED: 3beta-hydroxysteroid-dehydrogenase/decarboxylase isoform X2 [Nicotiana attenuata]OIT02243.1 3beta-hydroxysteroid-dehydrogenasedecarboxylase isoform 3 [Nicotiana attenuata]